MKTADSVPSDPVPSLARRARRGRSIRVAVVVTELATLIDFAGPWEALVELPNIGSKPPFHVYAVSTSRRPVTLGGGLKVVPEHTLRDAPKPDIILVPALGYGPYPEIHRWIREAHKRGTLIVSVCTGAFQLAEAGLLDGFRATTHHAFLDALRKAHPKIEVVGGFRFVKSSPSVYTAGGLTSGIDLAIHLVGRILGTRAARALARRLEYEGRGWEVIKARTISA